MYLDLEHCALNFFVSEFRESLLWTEGPAVKLKIYAAKRHQFKRHNELKDFYINFEPFLRSSQYIQEFGSIDIKSESD